MNIRPYIVLNDVSSQTVQGLIISSLPAIAKPKIRTMIEEIDGRDGDIVTPLGYSAYDKAVEIGLSYGYDIDDVIQFFNSSGKVVFSNEPEKYYNYAIYEQINFEKLIRFRTATVVFHVQPFKYSDVEGEKTFNFSGVSSGSLQIRNNGNIYSKPTITITGSGTVNLSLNGQQIFVLNMATTGTIILNIDEILSLVFSTAFFIFLVALLFERSIVAIAPIVTPIAIFLIVLPNDDSVFFI